MTVKLKVFKLKFIINYIIHHQCLFIDTIETNSYNLVQFFAKDGLVQMQLDSSHAFYNTPMIFDTITVYGVKNQPTSVLINKQKYDNFEYDDNYKVN